MVLYSCALKTFLPTPCENEADRCASVSATLDHAFFVQWSLSTLWLPDLWMQQRIWQDNTRTRGIGAEEAGPLVVPKKTAVLTRPSWWGSPPAASQSGSVHRQPHTHSDFTLTVCTKWFSSQTTTRTLRLYTDCPHKAILFTDNHTHTKTLRCPNKAILFTDNHTHTKTLYWLSAQSDSVHRQPHTH